MLKRKEKIQKEKSSETIKEGSANSIHMSNVALIDVDSHNFPNLVLMKLSSYHKSIGDQVEMWNGLRHYDLAYESKVFDDTYSKPFRWAVNADEIIRGGNGYDIKSKLPDEIEHMYPDYSLYGITDTAYGYLTRGCPRHCSFCIVSEKEGKVSHQVAGLSEFWQGQKNIVLLDPNITASKECEKLFDDLIQSRATIDFNQGLDARLLTDKGADQLNQIKTKMIHFAWDNYEMKTYEKLKAIRPLLKYDHHKLMVYVLVNYNTTIEQDLERITKLKELGYEPYVMVYDKPHAPKIIRQMQRWCNSKWIFHSVEWEEYMKGEPNGQSKKGNDKQRIV